MNSGGAARLSKEWARLSGRERVIAVAAAAVLLAAAIVKGVVEPALSLNDDLDARIETMQIKIAKSRRQSASPNSARDLAAAKTAGSEAEDMSRFLKEIEQTAQTAGARLVDVKPLPAQWESVQERLGVDLQLQTGMSGLVRFLDALQNSPKLLEVNRLQLAAGESGGLRASILVTDTVLLSAPARAKGGSSAQGSR